MGYLFAGLGVLLIVFVAVLLVRTVRFTPRPLPQELENEELFDKDRATEALRALVRCKTVSYPDASLEDDAEFEKLVGLLATLYPRVWETCELKRFDGRGLLFRWKGASSNAPTVLMAHYDVVPVSEEAWEKPPFSAELEDGVVWGRGTLDTKVTMNGILSAAEHLLAEGFVPAEDVYLAFSGSEEIYGTGASNMVS
ncbi:MAG: M20/M25/M40 family metallo-hydrolase, partial [Clostridia bacterium]|nr:M20/M25/M40 family metallo-hydrolase [Clostridia bacterium]